MKNKLFIMLMIILGFCTNIMAYDRNDEEAIPLIKLEKLNLEKGTIRYDTKSLGALFIREEDRLFLRVRASEPFMLCYSNQIFNNIYDKFLIKDIGYTFHKSNGLMEKEISLPAGIYNDFTFGVIPANDKQIKIQSIELCRITPINRMVEIRAQHDRLGDNTPIVAAITYEKTEKDTIKIYDRDTQEIYYEGTGEINEITIPIEEEQKIVAAEIIGRDGKLKAKNEKTFWSAAILKNIYNIVLHQNNKSEIAILNNANYFYENNEANGKLIQGIIDINPNVHITGEVLPENEVLKPLLK